jgi:starvation-inducible DNA-binding protein
MTTATAKPTDKVPFRTRNDIPIKQREAIDKMLNERLSDLNDLRSQTKHAHWNVKGHHFFSLHFAFDKFAATLTEYIDTVAERITALGGVAHGTVRMAATGTTLDEFPADTFEGVAVARVLADRYAAAANAVREGIALADEHKDAGTADMLTDVVRDLDQYLWFLEAFLTDGTRPAE